MLIGSFYLPPQPPNLGGSVCELETPAENKINSIQVKISEHMWQPPNWSLKCTTWLKSQSSENLWARGYLSYRAKWKIYLSHALYCCLEIPKPLCFSLSLINLLLPSVHSVCQRLDLSQSKLKASMIRVVMGCVFYHVLKTKREEIKIFFIFSLKLRPLHCMCLCLEHMLVLDIHCTYTSWVSEEDRFNIAPSWPTALFFSSYIHYGKTSLRLLSEFLPSTCTYFPSNANVFQARHSLTLL